MTHLHLTICTQTNSVHDMCVGVEREGGVPQQCSVGLSVTLWPCLALLQQTQLRYKVYSCFLAPRVLHDTGKGRSEARVGCHTLFLLEFTPSFGMHNPGSGEIVAGESCQKGVVTVG